MIKLIGAIVCLIGGSLWVWDAFHPSLVSIPMVAFACGFTAFICRKAAVTYFIDFLLKR